MLDEPDISTGQPEGPDLPDLTPDELEVACAVIGLSPATSPLSIAADLGFKPHQFLATLQRPHVRRWIDAALAAEDLRIELIAKRAKADALETLSSLTRDTSIDPIERRRAASAVLRALARPVPPRSRHETHSHANPHVSPHAPATGQSDLGASHPTPPDAADRAREAGMAEAAARAAHQKQLQQWKSDADAIRRRLDFKTSEAAARSVAKIITTADPGDTDAALHALFLVTSTARNYEDPEKFAHHTRYLMRAAGGDLANFEFLRGTGIWDCFRVVLQPRGAHAEPLDLAMWFTSTRMSGNDPCQLWAIVPWEEDNWRHPGNARQSAFHNVDPLNPLQPPDPDPPRRAPPRNGHSPPTRAALPGPAPP